MSGHSFCVERIPSLTLYQGAIELPIISNLNAISNNDVKLIHYVQTKLVFEKTMHLKNSSHMGLGASVPTFLHANNKCAEQPLHTGSIISASVI